MTLSNSCRITTYQFESFKDQCQELFPNYDCGLLYTPYIASTNDTNAVAAGGSFYWYYKEQKKNSPSMW